MALEQQGEERVIHDSAAFEDESPKEVDEAVKTAIDPDAVELVDIQ